jgi:hypothetical protein
METPHSRLACQQMSKGADQIVRSHLTVLTNPATDETLRRRALIELQRWRGMPEADAYLKKQSEIETDE